MPRQQPRCAIHSIPFPQGCLLRECTIHVEPERIFLELLLPILPSKKYR